MVTPMVVVVVPRHNVVMIMVHGPFTDHVAKLVGLDVTMVMIVMDNIGVAVTIDLSNSILIVVMSAHRCASQHERSDCQGTEECLFHERIWRVDAVSYSSFRAEFSSPGWIRGGKDAVLRTRGPYAARRTCDKRNRIC